MLPVQRKGQQGPLLVLLHWLGGGAQTWEQFSQSMAERGVRCVAVDLPGFGDAAGISGYTVAAMVDAVAETVIGLRTAEGDRGPWLLAGHSMGGKIASVLARRALDGAVGLEALRGLILVSASPPSPEPMTDAKRSEMLDDLGQSSGSAKEDRKSAIRFVENNVGKIPLTPNALGRATDGVLAMNRTAFRHWLQLGSKEDWSERVGTLNLPAIVFAGSEDRALGPQAQRETNLRHLPQAKLVPLEGAGHLAPLERAGELVEFVTQFVANLGLDLTVRERSPGVAVESLMQSDRTSSKTHEVMATRLADRQTWNAIGQAFSEAEMRTLRALTGRVVPLAGFDVAAALDQQLATGPGDGWRFAKLPPDLDAWRRGLHSLDVVARREHGVSFLALSAEQQDRLLEQASIGDAGRSVLGSLHIGESADAFSGGEMKLWFEDVRAACVQAYISDPRAMSRIGYTGFADDFGFTQIELGQHEEFER